MVILNKVETSTHSKFHRISSAYRRLDIPKNTHFITKLYIFKVFVLILYPINFKRQYLPFSDPLWQNSALAMIRRTKDAERVKIIANCLYAF